MWTQLGPQKCSGDAEIAGNTKCVLQRSSGWLGGERGSEAYDADGPTHGRKSAIFLALAKEPGVCVGVTKQTTLCLKKGPNFETV